MRPRAVKAAVARLSAAPTGLDGFDEMLPAPRRHETVLGSKAAVEGGAVIK